MNSFCFRFSVVLFNIPTTSKSRNTLYLSSPRLYLFIVLNLVVFVFLIVPDLGNRLLASLQLLKNSMLLDLCDCFS